LYLLEDACNAYWTVESFLYDEVIVDSNWYDQSPACYAEDFWSVWENEYAKIEGLWWDKWSALGFKENEDGSVEDLDVGAAAVETDVEAVEASSPAVALTSLATVAVSLVYALLAI
jgi:hypothetical protein